MELHFLDALIRESYLVLLMKMLIIIYHHAKTLKDLVVLMWWPVDMRFEGADPVHFLSKTLASLNLKDELGTSSSAKKKGKAQILNFLANFIQFRQNSNPCAQILWEIITFGFLICYCNLTNFQDQKFREIKRVKPKGY